MYSPAGREERSDAQRSREAIIEATLMTLTVRPGASMGDIAAAAGVSRGTLYAHFANRHRLLAAALRWITAEVEHRLDEVDPAIPAADALDQLVATSWWVLGHFAGLRAAARTEIGPAADTREEPLERIRAILVRGRAEGAFRDDQDLGWQSECFYAILRVGASRIGEDGPPRATVALEMVRTIRALLEAAPAASAAAVSSHRPR